MGKVTFELPLAMITPVLFNLITYAAFGFEWN